MRNLCVLASLVVILGCQSKKDEPSAGGSGGSAAAMAPGSGAAPGSAAAPEKPAPKTLFDRLGGTGAITAVVEEFVNRTTTDPRIKERFFNTDAAALKQYLADFVCSATGGTCKYTGRDMATAHAGMDLVDDEFNALVEDLKAALDELKVPAKEQNELLGALAAMKPDIVHQ